MSYSRQYHERIAVHYSGSTTVPSNQTGGTVPYSGTAYEDIYTTIEVDTRPFDHSVGNCNSSVTTLTGAVIATEAAQVASITINSQKVAGTIVDGFFGYIRSEISQQIAELSQKIDAYLGDLREKAKMCTAKQTKMETDYHRISSRYLKIFDDLNNELKNRIYELNKSAFEFKNNLDHHADRTTGNDVVSTVTVFGLESGTLQAKISASIVKKRALNAIRQANIFLWKQKKLDTTIKQSMLNENISTIKFLPVCFMETNNEQSQIGKNIYQSGFLPNSNVNRMIEKFQSLRWKDTTKENKDIIQRYFNSELSNAYSTDNSHNNRVREMIVGFFDENSMKSNQQ
jgi:hypothetical protein